MNPQGSRYRPHIGKGRVPGGMLLLVAGTLMVPSCTRVPTALRSKITVVGRVSVSPSKPLPGTTLFFTSREPGLNDNAFAIADSSGAYSVRLISGTYEVRIEPTIGDGLLAHSERVTVSDNRTRVDFTFSGCHVTGRVVAPKGALLDSGQVTASLIAPGYCGAMSLLKQGSYSLLLPTGRYSFYAVAAGYWSGFSPERKESVSVTADTTIDFQLGGIQVSGRVWGPEGLPMRDVGVTARGANYNYTVQNRTTTDGSYELYVPPDSYGLRFSPPYPFFIVPRVVGPLAISAPTSIDEDLSGIEWTGTVRRSDTNEPAPEITVIVRATEDDDEETAAIRTDPQGRFRFILEANQRYDLSTSDPERRETIVRMQGVTATADTALEILTAPQATVNPADSTITLSIRSVAGKTVHRAKKRWPPDWIEVTLHNAGRDTVMLVLPGSGSDWGRRTPIMDWEVRSAGGSRMERTPVAVCGNINPLQTNEVFSLSPGGERKFHTAFPEHYPYEKSHRYQLRLSYENRPAMDWWGSRLGAHDPDAMRLLRQSTPCRLVSDVLEVKVE
jgi:hypothetical protein